MTTFNETDHPRRGDGKFAAKEHAESGLALSSAPAAAPRSIGVPVTAAGTHYAVDAAADDRTRTTQAQALFAEANRRIGGTITVEGSDFVIEEPAAREQFGSPGSRNRIYYATPSGNYHSEISVDALRHGFRGVALPVEDDSPAR